jgi:hypothetical protein
MAISKSDQIVLQQIVDEEGNCLKASRCKVCPFRSMCLPEFLFPQPLTQNQRMTMALDILVHHSLIDEDVEVQDLSKDQQYAKDSKRTNR